VKVRCAPANGVTTNRSKHENALAVKALWTIRKGEHEASLRVRQVPGIGAEIALFIDGELQSRLYRAHEQAELATAIAETRASSRHAVGNKPHRRSGAMR
jgi:hypothetical protein